MTRKFGSLVPGLGTTPDSKINLDQIGGTALNGPGTDNLDYAGGNVVAKMLAEGYVFNTATPGWERLRTPNIFKTLSFTVSSNIWTPAAGKKARLLAYLLEVSSNAIVAVAGQQDLQLNDGGVTTAHTHTIFAPGAAGPVGAPLLAILVILGQNGLLSTTANNSFAIALTAAFTGGFARCSMWGTEE
jgi:hypothetical protein